MSALVVTSGSDLSIPAALPVIPRYAHSKKSALTALQRGDEICCAILPLEPGDTQARDLVAAMRVARPLLPILVYAPSPSTEIRSLTYAHDVVLATSGCTDDTLSQFVTQALTRPRGNFERLESQLLQMGKIHSLTPCELRIATAVTRGMTRTEMLEAFGVSVNTLKSHTRSILKKTGYSSLSDLARDALSVLLVNWS